MAKKPPVLVILIGFAAALVVAVWLRGATVAGAEPAASSPREAAAQDLRVADDATSLTLRENAIRRVYDAYAARSAPSAGGPVEVALDDFRTVGADDFDEVPLFPELATLSTDWELAAVIEVRVEEGRPERTIRFRPHWRPVEEAPPAELLGRVASRIVGPGGRHFPSRWKVEALTSYRVRVFYDGLEQIYRAAAMWRHDADGRLVFGIVDNVVPDVALAVDDGHGTGSLLGDRHSVADPKATRREVAAGQCAAERTELRFASSPSVDGAIAPPGDGRPSFVAVHACSCASDCSARCEASTQATYDGCRTILADSTSDLPQRAIAIAYVVDQSMPPGFLARCSAGLSCNLLDCPDGICGDTWVGLEHGPPVRLDVVGGTAGGTGSSHRMVCGSCSSTN